MDLLSFQHINRISWRIGIHQPPFLEQPFQVILCGPPRKVTELTERAAGEVGVVFEVFREEVVDFLVNELRRMDLLDISMVCWRICCVILFYEFCFMLP